MPELIRLNAGPAPWMNGLRILIAVAAAISLLSAPSPASWRFGALTVLAAMFLFDHRAARKRPANASLVIRLDGTLRQNAGSGTIEGVMDGGAWVSRWLCVLHWTPLDGERRRHSLVCASRNRAEDYRRLLVWIRMGSFQAGERPSWQSS